MTSKKLSDYLRKEVIYTASNFQTQEEVFKRVAFDAEKENLVSEDFFQGLVTREKEFPTGIPLGEFGAAIPHTDADLVKEEFVAIIVNEQLIDFKSMEDEHVIVPTKIIFLLGLNEPHAQLEMLQSLMGILQNQELLTDLSNVKGSQNLIELIKTNHL
ncbi:PTS sugar transporter subunit IIA [Enterococcus italicus]|uniref:PTS sugar transporter subunit IIA n=1 Tax=Enterococcus italicus TaxID=246144 RepID=UPI0028AA63BE|nr:PTS sugar transporter subunit IIA [Enterococcus italicus]